VVEAGREVGPFDPRGTAGVGGLFGNDPLRDCPPGWAESETVARSFLRVAMLDARSIIPAGLE
jgi:hypothetical protein